MDDAVKKARTRAMYLLKARSRTRQELYRRLKEKGFQEPEIEQAIAYVESYGYIDDYKYAQNYILYRIQEKSRQKILMELHQKGVSRETAERAWEEIIQIQAPCESELIRKLVQKKCGQQRELSEKEYRRLYGFLIRRGFQFEDIRQVFEEEKIHIKS